MWTSRRDAHSIKRDSWKSAPLVDLLRNKTNDTCTFISVWLRLVWSCDVTGENDTLTINNQTVGAQISSLWSNRDTRRTTSRPRSFNLWASFQNFQQGNGAVPLEIMAELHESCDHRQICAGPLMAVTTAVFVREGSRSESLNHGDRLTQVFETRTRHTVHIPSLDNVRCLGQISLA